MGAGARRPAVAGQFYPADPAALREEVRGYLSAAGPAHFADPLVGVIVPHAGTMFSGPVAAFSYRALQSEPWDAVVLIGGSHHYHLPFAHVYARGAWETPLGAFPVAEELATALIGADERVVEDPRPHLPEHSLELQLPFLAETLGLVPIVPVLVGPAAPEACAALGRAVAAVNGHRRVAIVASTDLSHYHDYATAQERDRAAIAAIGAWRPETLALDCAEHAVEACGGGAIAAAELAAAGRGATHATLLRHATSGDVPGGGFDRVVGYAAMAFLAAAPAQRTDLPALTDAEQRTLLAFAREVLEARVENRSEPPLPVADARMTAVQGVFVTLRTGDGTLRGCLGRVEPPLPLAEAVQAMTAAAALRDPRFVPLQCEELADVHIEISALGVPEPIRGPHEVTIGRHGLVVQVGEQAGLLLPHVAVAQRWTPEQFLAGTCHKAGLPRDAWRRPDAHIQRFQAQAFGEPT